MSVRAGLKKYRRIGPDCGLGKMEVGKTRLRRVEVKEKGHDNQAGDPDKAGHSGLEPHIEPHINDQGAAPSSRLRADAA